MKTSDGKETIVAAVDDRHVSAQESSENSQEWVDLSQEWDVVEKNTLQGNHRKPYKPRHSDYSNDLGSGLQCKNIPKIATLSTVTKKCVVSFT